MYRVAIELYKKVDASDVGPDHQLYDLWLHQKDKSIVFEEYPTREEAESAMLRLSGEEITTERRP